MVSSGALAMGCGDDEGPTTFCCALEHMCAACSCETYPEFSKIAKSKDESACRFVFEDRDLGCTNLGETDAIGACAEPPE